MKKIIVLPFLFALTFLISCNEDAKKPTSKTESTVVEQFSDTKILRYDIPQWEELSLDQQKLVYYLTQAGLSGRDIMYDQNYRHNLKIRRTLENIYTTYKGDKTSDNWKNFEIYLKKIWFANGIHHHYANDKFKPAFSKEYFDSLLKDTNISLLVKHMR